MSSSRLRGLAAVITASLALVAATATAGDGCPGEGGCFEANGSPGCDDEACCIAVCDIDPFCCKAFWDDACAETAGLVCDTCPAPGHCLLYHESPGCTDEACCEAVCEIQPLCCQFIWDGECSGIAEDICDLCLGDQNEDAAVNVQDLILIIQDWGCENPPGPCPGDVSGNGIVDVNDMVLVIVSWGPCD